MLGGVSFISLIPEFKYASKCLQLLLPRVCLQPHNQSEGGVQSLHSNMAGNMAASTNNKPAAGGFITLIISL